MTIHIVIDTSDTIEIECYEKTPFAYEKRSVITLYKSAYSGSKKVIKEQFRGVQECLLKTPMSEFIFTDSAKWLSEVD